jgi:hypothetical protein
MLHRCRVLLQLANFSRLYCYAGVLASQTRIWNGVEVKVCKRREAAISTVVATYDPYHRYLVVAY